MPARFQFSLRTLVLVVITVGALMGFFFARYENAKLREEIIELRDEAGILDITDPHKMWVRDATRDDDDGWRRRIYVPNRGKYRIGIQTKKIDLSMTDFDRANADYLELDLVRGQYVVAIKILQQSEELRKYEVIVSGHSRGVRYFRDGSVPWKKNGYVEDFYFPGLVKNTYYTPVASRAVNMDKPLLLLCVKVVIDPNSAVLKGGYAANGPGLLIWFEEAPK